MISEKERISAVKTATRIETAICLVVNALLNALVAWLIYRHAAWIATDFWSIFIDSCITCFCICFFTAYFTTRAARRYLHTGLFRLLPQKGTLLGRLPRHSVLLGICFAGIAMVPLALCLGLGFSLLGIGQLSLWGFILYKGIWSGLLGGCICALTLARHQLA